MNTVNTMSAKNTDSVKIEHIRYIPDNFFIRYINEYILNSLTENFKPDKVFFCWIYHYTGREF